MDKTRQQDMKYRLSKCVCCCVVKIKRKTFYVRVEDIHLRTLRRLWPLIAI